MKLLAFLFSVISVGILISLKNRVNQHRYPGYSPYHEPDKYVWLGN